MLENGIEPDLVRRGRRKGRRQRVVWRANGSETWLRLTSRAKPATRWQAWAVSSWKCPGKSGKVSEKAGESPRECERYTAKFGSFDAAPDA